MRRHAEHLNQLINSFVLGEDEPTQRHQALASPQPALGNASTLKRPALAVKPSSARQAEDEWEAF
jgi:methyl-accepting chemotaxis protein